MGSEKQIPKAVLSQSLFHTTYIPSPTWRSYVTSSVIHGAIILALLLITFPVLRQEVEQRQRDSVTLIAPVIPHYESRIPPPKHLDPKQRLVRNEPKPKIVAALKPPPVKPLEVAPKRIAAAPEVKVTAAASVRPTPDFTRAPPAPKPQVRTGSFETADAAKAERKPAELKVGGFGDPSGVPPSSDARPSPVAMAQVGSFDLPPGGGHTGGGGRNTSGGVHQTSFGSVGDLAGTPGATGHGNGAVHTGAFEESSSAAPQGVTPARARPVEPVFTPVEILSKPKPSYTEEARNLKLEGQVSLDVMFLSNGSIRILRVVHGLGHGLDEAAQQAALQVRFRPATRGGVPVDTNATIHITFQLT